MFSLFHITPLDKLILSKLPQFIFLGVDYTVFCYLTIIAIAVSQYFIIKNGNKKVH